MAGELTAITTYNDAILMPEINRVITVIAAAAVTIGQPAYMTSSGTFGIADANGSGTLQFRGIFMRAAAAGEAVPLCIYGPVSCFNVSSSTPGVPLYVSDTAGSIATSAGSTTIVVGLVYTLPDGTNCVWIDAQWSTIWA